MSLNTNLVIDEKLSVEKIYERIYNYVEDNTITCGRSSVEAFNEAIQQYDEYEFPEVIAEQLYFEITNEVWFRQ